MVGRYGRQVYLAEMQWRFRGKKTRLSCKTGTLKSGALPLNSDPVNETVADDYRKLEALHCHFKFRIEFDGVLFLYRRIPKVTAPPKVTPPRK